MPDIFNIFSADSDSLGRWAGAVILGAVIGFLIVLVAEEDDEPAMFNEAVVLSPMHMRAYRMTSGAVRPNRARAGQNEEKKRKGRAKTPK